MSEPVRLYALYHVDTEGAQPSIRFPRDRFPAMPKDEAERRASEVRVGKGRGSAYPSRWTVEAHPDKG